jgi:tetratricopeptide (TPR) repeat protein
LWGRRSIAEAETAFRDAVAVLEALVGDTAAPSHRHDLGKTLNFLGVLLFDSKRPADAEPVFRKGFAVQEALAAEFPDRMDYLREAGAMVFNVGNTLDARGRTAEALPFFRKALDTQIAAAAKEPNPIGRRYLSQSLRAVSRAAVVLGDHREAAARGADLVKFADGDAEWAFQAGRVYLGAADAVRKDATLDPAARARVEREYAAAAVEALRASTARPESPLERTLALGVALVRAEQWQQGADVLARAHDGGEDLGAFEWLLVAKAQHRLGRADEARAAYDRAASLEEALDEDALRLRAEVASLLGVPADAAPTPPGAK